MKKKHTDDVADFAGAPAPKALGPADVQQKEFRVSRFGGYKMRDVDEFLDQITESMNAMVEENRRLRTQGGGSLVGAPDLADTARQADEIIQRARAQAEQIVRTARAGGAQATVTGVTADRAPVNAFLLQERTFLQSLAVLVQEHAETVKGMVRADRSAAAAGPAPSAPVPASGPAPSAPARPRAAEDASAHPDAPPIGRPSDPRPTVPMGKTDEPIHVEEPAPSHAPSSARRDDDQPGDGPDRSLRELFWGED